MFHVDKKLCVYLLFGGGGGKITSVPQEVSPLPISGVTIFSLDAQIIYLLCITAAIYQGYFNLIKRELFM
jgi:hypothetical protein